MLSLPANWAPWIQSADRGSGIRRGWLHHLGRTFKHSTQRPQPIAQIRQFNPRKSSDLFSPYISDCPSRRCNPRSRPFSSIPSISQPVPSSLRGNPYSPSLVIRGRSQWVSIPRKTIPPTLSLPASTSFIPAASADPRSPFFHSPLPALQRERLPPPHSVIPTAASPCPEFSRAVGAKAPRQTIFESNEVRVQMR
jgi:hypothetical protein